LKDDKRPTWRLENQCCGVRTNLQQSTIVVFEKLESELGYDGVKDDGINRLSSSKDDCYV
jgi:hypothetical protein